MWGRVTWSWPAFVLYLCALGGMVVGGLVGLFQSGHAAFLGPILVGLFFFYVLWEAVVGKEVDPPERSR